jgi:hypothetical protein
MAAPAMHTTAHTPSQRTNKATGREWIGLAIIAPALRGIGAAASLPRGVDGAADLLSAAQAAYSNATSFTFATAAGIV